MKTNRHIFTVLALTTALVSCKDEASSTGTSEQSSTTPVIANSPESGCSVASVAGGAQITCGSTTALVANGTAVATAPVPRLIDGPANALPENQNVQIGDYLISMTRQDGAELITLWSASENATFQYENGAIYPRSQAISYDSRDCSGPGVYKVNDNLSLAMGDRIVFWDRYYRIGSELTHCYPRSVKEKDGTCTEITGPMAGDFNGFVAEPSGLRVTTRLSKGYRIKVK
jgi:hypothetical protein